MTDHICSECGKSLELTEEVYLVQILYQSHQGFYNVEEAGDFVFTPHFFCVQHWEGNKEALREQEADEPSSAVIQPTATAVCSHCGTGIDDMEMVGVITIGELRRSQRMPGGEPTIHFAGIQTPEIWCIGCMHRMNEEVIQLWDEGLPVDDEDEAEEEAIERWGLGERHVRTG